MNTDTAYKIVKLTNGEEIICEINDDDNGEYKINFPLKMEVRSHVTKEGVVDSLNLSRWIGPYTEQSFFNIKTSHVLTIADASEGLCRYYDHVIREINKSGSSRTTELLNDINDEDVYEDLLKEAETDKTIH